MKAIRVHEYGGPETLRFEDVATPAAVSGSLLVRVTHAGVNFIDIYHRTGRYAGQLPFTPGMDGAGVVEDAGEGAEGFSRGDRVAWSSQLGSYAELISLPVKHAVPIPDSVTDETAAAVMLQGMTAHYLATSTWPLKPGETCVIHAAAGGVGLLLVQIAKHLGARVIGTVSTDEKAELAHSFGADEVIVYTRDDFEIRVRELTDGRGADVVYDSVGRDTFMKSLSSLRPCGLMALFGASSGAVEPFDPMILNNKGSLFVTRPKLFDYISDRESLLSRSGDVFRWIGEKWLRVTIGGRYSLDNAARAHADLESRATKGKLILVP